MKMLTALAIVATIATSLSAVADGGASPMPSKRVSELEKRNAELRETNGALASQNAQLKAIAEAAHDRGTCTRETFKSGIIQVGDSCTTLSTTPRPWARCTDPNDAIGDFYKSCQNAEFRAKRENDEARYIRKTSTLSTRWRLESENYRGKRIFRDLRSNLKVTEPLDGEWNYDQALELCKDGYRLPTGYYIEDNGIDGNGNQDSDTTKLIRDGIWQAMPFFAGPWYWTSNTSDYLPHDAHFGIVVGGGYEPGDLATKARGDVIMRSYIAHHEFVNNAGAARVFCVSDTTVE